MRTATADFRRPDRNRSKISDARQTSVIHKEDSGKSAKPANLCYPNGIPSVKAQGSAE
jgi:hypothetical protein